MHIPRWGPLGLLIGAPEEVWFLFRIAAYAVFIGTVYWFVSYDPAGTMMLYGFGIGAGLGTVMLGMRAREVARETEPIEVADAAGRSEAAQAPNGPFGDERGRIPSASYAPFSIGLGVATIGLGFVFGPWLLAIGILLFLTGGTEWLSAVGREYQAMAEPIEREHTPEREHAREHERGQARAGTLAQEAPVSGSDGKS